MRRAVGAKFTLLFTNRSELFVHAEQQVHTQQKKYHARRHVRNDVLHNDKYRKLEGCSRVASLFTFTTEQ